jgi:heat-inducible transcriptional repressor
MELERRKEEILKKIVAEYIDTGQPVGSEKLNDKLGLSVSPATVRNDMAELEKLGYILQPYTSAGRVPTTKGYRFYVEDLVKKSKPIEFNKIKIPKPEKIKTLHEALSEVSDLISLHTKEISLVVSPCMEEIKINYIHFFSVAPQALYMVLVTSMQSSEAVLLGNFPISKSTLMKLENFVNSKISSLSMGEALLKLRSGNFFRNELSSNSEIIQSIYRYFKDELNKGTTREIYIKGISNLLTTRISLAEHKVKFLLDILEEKKVLSEIIQNVPTEEGNVGFSIGEENKLPELWDYSLISIKYTVKEMEGTLALLGPVRMDYVKGIYVLEKIADKLEEMAEKIVE